MPKGLGFQLDLGADSVAQPSYDVSNAGNELQMRAFLFRDGQLYKDGNSIDKTVGASDLDMEAKREVGRGASASVYHVLHQTTGEPMALKMIPINTRTHRDEITAELSVLSSGLLHPHVVRHFGAFWEPESHTIGIVMEWMDYSLHDLTHVASAFEEDILRNVVFQLLLALRFLHSEQHVMHRDIKPSNLLVNGAGQVKIGDFGISKCVSTLHVSSTFVGTQMFMAPERLDEGEYTYSSDVWSFGLTVVALARGCDPWADGTEAPTGQTNLFAIMQRIMSGQVPGLPDAFSDDAKDFVRRCLVVDHEERATADDLLRHPWLAGVTEEGAQDMMKIYVSTVTELTRRVANQQARLAGR